MRSSFVFCLPGILATIALSSCNGKPPTGNGIQGDSVSPTMDTINKSTASSHVPSDTTNTAYPNKNWNTEFLLYDVPASAHQLAWLEAGIKHCQDKRIAAAAQAALRDYKKMDAALKNYLVHHQGVQLPSIDTVNTIKLGQRYGSAWDKSWLNSVVSYQDSLSQMVSKSRNALTDTALQEIVSGNQPVIESAFARLKEYLHH